MLTIQPVSFPPFLRRNQTNDHRIWDVRMGDVHPDVSDRSSHVMEFIHGEMELENHPRYGKTRGHVKCKWFSYHFDFNKDKVGW